MNLEEMKQYIKDYISKHKIYIKEMTTGELKNPNNKYTKYWYNNQNKEYISKIFCNTSTYYHHYVEDSTKKMLIILNNFEDDNIKEILEEKNKNNECIRSGINRLLNITNYKKYKFNHIIVLSALNPYHMDLTLFKTSEDKSIYKIFTIFRYIAPLNMNDTFIIHVPVGLYEYYKNYFEEYSEKFVKSYNKEK